MVLRRRNQQTFHRGLYRGQLQTVVLLKRADDQAEGQVTAYQLYQCRRGNISKSGEAIAFDTAALTTTNWLIPCKELRRVGINYINVLDRIVDMFQMWWQPESPQTITLAVFDNYFLVPTLRVDPYPNQVLLGIPGVQLGPY